MVCKYAKFVVHYEDGTTVHEDRTNENHWDELPKEGIIALGILFDSQLLYYPNTKDENEKPLAIRDPTSNLHLKEVYPEYVLKGSKKYNYGWFQQKDAVRHFGKVGKRKAGKYVLSLMIGRVIDPEGHCEVAWGAVNRQVKSAYTTLHSLGFDADGIKLQGINLEECGTEKIILEEDPRLTLSERK